MKKEWRIYSKKADFNALSEKFNIDRLTAGLIVNRVGADIKAIDKYLNGGLSDLYDEKLLPDIEKAADILIDSIKMGKGIRIVGDYDIDGVCSVYILYKGISSAVKYISEREPVKNEGVFSGISENIKAKSMPDYVIPDRIKDGYGINLRIIEEAIEDGKEVIITCDNGIAAIEELAFAKEKGLTVIVTDHHDVRKKKCGETYEEDGTRYAESDVLPPADAVVNPKRSDSVYPDACICGAVVAWKFIKVVFEKLFGMHMPEEVTKIYYKEMLPFAAIATVGDVMELKDENRIIVKEGLKIINSKELSNIGLIKLIEGCGISGKETDTYHIGFILGPCINAGGRLETAETALKLFLTEDPVNAYELSEKLIELNSQRKAMTEAGVKAASKLCEEKYKGDSVLVIYVEDLHESLAGIVAGRIREKYSKPTFIITDAKEGLKGSGRSIEAYHMFDKLCEAAELLTKFGGHPMAAGLSLEREKLSELRKRLNENCGLSEADFTERGRIDFAVPVSYISCEMIENIGKLKPFGAGNERPVLAERELSVYEMKVLGKNKNVLKLRLGDKSGYPVSAVMFGEAERLKADIEEKLSKKGSINIVYYPEINEFNGKRSLQLNLLDVL